MDLQSLEEKDQGRKDFPYISANEKYIEGYIDLVVASEPKKALYAPKYKVSDYVKFEKGANIPWTSCPLCGKNMTIMCKSRTSMWMNAETIITEFFFFPPYDVPSAWNKAQTSDGKYLHTVDDMKRFESTTQKVTSFYETIRGEEYEEKLPFLVHNVASIENHIPKRFEQKDMQENENGYYHVVWNGPIVHAQKHEGITCLKDGKRQSREYWQQSKTKQTRRTTTTPSPSSGSKTLKKRTNVQKFAFETFDDELPRAQALWADIANDNTKFEKKNKQAFQRIIHIDDRAGKVSRAMFRVGDVFVAFLEPETMYYGYLVNHFYKKKERKMSYGVLFSASEGPGHGCGESICGIL